MGDKNASIDRLSEQAQQWFLSEPLLFAAWTTHRVVSHPSVATIRVGRGLIEFNPDFIADLDTRMLREVMKFEAVRIVLKHPYDRKQQHAEMSYEASNLAIQECMRTAVPLPSARERFDSEEHDQKSYEYYYQLLNEEHAAKAADGSRDGTEPKEDADGDPDSDACDADAIRDDGIDSGDEVSEDEPSNCEGDAGQDARECDDGGQCEGEGQCAGDGLGAGDGESGDGDCKSGNGAANGAMISNLQKDFATLGPQRENGDLATLTATLTTPRSDLVSYCELERVATENTANWGHDAYYCERINEVISDVEASQSWGTVPGTARELILATMIPKLDYRRVLRAFRANILSAQRRLTRMKPSRRYGFEYMGSRRDFCTKLLFAVDVSGSVGSADVSAAFSIVNRLFKYGIESIDVIWFDTEVRNEEPLELKRAWRNFEVDGRGGTNFQPLMNYLDEHRQYDGLIVFTDGVAPVPTPPQRNRRTRIAWLFNHEESWRASHEALGLPGMLTAYVLADS